MAQGLHGLHVHCIRNPKGEERMPITSLWLKGIFKSSGLVAGEEGRGVGWIQTNIQAPSMRMASCNSGAIWELVVALIYALSNNFSEKYMLDY